MIVILFVLVVLTHKHPRTIRYTLTKSGIFEADRLYAFSNLKSFYVDETTYETPTLLLEVKRWFLPIVSISLPSEIAPQDIRMYMRPNLMERELKEPLFHHLFEMFGI